MIKLVLSDVDGTLIPLGAGGASERTMRAIRRVQEAGVRFGLATGRDIVELMQLFGGDDIAFRTGILSNGKKIMVDGKIARLSLIDNDALQRMVDIVIRYPRTFMTVYPLHTDESNPIYCMGATEEELVTWSKLYAFTGIVVPEVPDVQIIGATIASEAPEDVLEEIRLRALEACPEFDIVMPAPRWWDVLPKGLNKGTALQMLMQELGISANEVVMFGDADNDLAILRAVEHSVAVANATPAAKAASAWHIGPCDEDAVAQALEQLADAAAGGGVPSFMRG